MTSVAAVVIKFLQLLVFPLQVGIAFESFDTIVPLRELSYTPSVAGWVMRAGNRTAYFVLLYISAVWVAAYGALQMWALLSFAGGGIPVIWPLRWLRGIANFSATVAFIPLLNFLVTPFMCGDPHIPPFWEDAGYTCWTRGHLAHAIVAAVLAVALVGMCAIFTVFFYDNHPLSANVASKVHGRADLVLLAVKVTLVVMVELLTRFIGAYASLGIMTVAGGAWFAAYYVTMPYLHHPMNQWQLAAASMFTFTTIAAFVSRGYVGFDAAVALYMGLPLAGAVGAYMADGRRRRIRPMPLARMRWADDVGLRGRYELGDLVHSALESESSGGGGGGSMSSAAVHPTASSRGPNPGPSGMMSASGLGPGAPRGSTGSGAGDRGSVEGDLLAGDRTLSDDMWMAAFGQMDGPSRAAVLRNRLPSHRLAALEQLYRQAVVRFPTSAILQTLIANFYGVFKDDKGLQLGHLLQAQRLSPPLDVAFLVYHARQQAESVAGNGVSSALNRVSFEKHLADARRTMTKGAGALATFWNELMETTPNLDVLDSSSTALATATEAADAAFTELFNLDPQSVLVMRLFSQLQLCILNNPDRSATISAEADRLEEARVKEDRTTHGATTAPFGLKLLAPINIDVQQADSVCAVRIAATARDLGTVRGANASALRTFGFTRAQLERRNVNVLIPPPIAEYHDGFIRRFLATGEGKFVGSTRVAFGRHRSGAIMPMAMTLRDATEDDSHAEIVALMRPITSPDNFALLDGRFMVRACDVASAQAFGVDASTLESEECHITDFVPDFYAHMEALGDSRHGAVLQLRRRTAMASGSMMVLDAPYPTEATVAARSGVESGGGARAGVWTRAQLQSVPLGPSVVFHVFVWNPRGVPVPGTAAIASPPPTGSRTAHAPSAARPASGASGHMIGTIPSLGSDTAPGSAGASAPSPQVADTTPDGSIASNEADDGDDAGEHLHSPGFLGGEADDSSRNPNPLAHSRGASIGASSPPAAPTTPTRLAVVAVPVPVAAAKEGARGGAGDEVARTTPPPPIAIPASAHHPRADSEMDATAGAPGSTDVTALAAGLVTPLLPGTLLHTADPEAVAPGGGGSQTHLLTAAGPSKDVSTGSGGSSATLGTPPTHPPHSKPYAIATPTHDSGRWRRGGPFPAVVGDSQQTSKANYSDVHLLDSDRDDAARSHGSVGAGVSNGSMGGFGGVGGIVSMPPPPGGRPAMHVRIGGPPTAAAPRSSIVSAAAGSGGSGHYGGGGIGGGIGSSGGIGNSGVFGGGGGGGGADGERRSVASSAHTTGGRTIANRLRKTLDDLRTRRVVMPRLQWLKRIGWLLVALHLALVAMCGALIMARLEHIETQMQYAELAGQAVRSMMLSNTIISARISATNFWRAPLPAALDTDLLIASSTLAHAAPTMYALVSDSATARSFLLDKVVNVASLLPADVFAPGVLTGSALAAVLADPQYQVDTAVGGTVMVLRMAKMSLLRFALELSTAIAAVVTVPAMNTARTIPAVAVHTGEPQAHTDGQVRMLSVEDMARSECDAAATLMENTALYIFVAVVVVMLIVTFAIIVPTVYAIERMRDNLLARFADAPRPVIAVLQKLSATRLRTIQRQNDDDALGSDSTEDDESDDGGAGIGGGAADGEGGEGSDDDMEVDWDAIMKASTGLPPARRSSIAASLLANAAARARAGATPAAGSSTGTSSTAPPGAMALVPRHSFRSDAGAGGGGAATSPSTTRNAWPAAAPASGAAGAVRQGSRGSRSAAAAAAAPRGPIRRPLRSYALSSCLFSTPAIVMMVSYGVMLALVRGYSASISNMQRASILADLRASGVQEVYMCLLDSIGDTGFASVVNARIDACYERIAVLRNINEQLVFGSDPATLPPIHGYSGALPARVTGSENDGFAQMSDDDNALLRTVQLGDACSFVSQQPRVLVGWWPALSLTECDTFVNGAVHHGLSGTFNVFLASTIRALERRAAATIPITSTGMGTIPSAAAMSMGGFGNATVNASDTVPYSIKDEFAGADFQASALLNYRALQPSYVAIAGLFRTRARTTVIFFRSLFVSLDIVYALVYVAGLVWIFLPNVGALNRTIQAKRALLLLLPPQVLVGVPTLREVATGIIAEGSLGTGAVPARRLSASSTGGATPVATAAASASAATAIRVVEAGSGV